MSTSNSEANAGLSGRTGQKFSARVRARAASPCWAWEYQFLGPAKDSFFGSKSSLLTLHMVGLARKRVCDLERLGFGEMGVESERQEKIVSIGRCIKKERPQENRNFY